MGRRAPGARYVSPATRSMVIRLRATDGTIYNFNADMTPPTNAACTGAGEVTCVIPMPLPPGSYVARLASYDGFLAGGNAPTNAPTGNKLSVDQALRVTITAKGKHAIRYALDGVPVKLVAVVPSGSVLTGSGTSFTMPRCAPSARISLYGVDAGGYMIVGGGAPLMSLHSGSSSLTVTLPWGQPSQLFGLKRSKTIPDGGSIVNLVAAADPSRPSGARTIRLKFTVSFDRSICGSR
jgi:hypothetical protein